MTKRYHAPKRRDRKTGQSPYAKYGKREFDYGSEHRAWQRAMGRKAKDGADHVR